MRRNTSPRQQPGPAAVGGLLNSVSYDSWPVPGEARYRDPAVVAATTAEELLAARRTAVSTALARPVSEAELADCLDPWNDPRVGRSWMALAGAADSRYTLDLVPALRNDETPKLLVWGDPSLAARTLAAFFLAAD